ncbi:PRC-barrel domain-containing protein [Leifsonia sp. YIM 134122]|uniref:PRC-barrel domain-containing protein n=1 Tax=Leifsonia stereocauli TaxID=3134136 RepID=A0ABU9VZY5_9MICO
MLPSNNIQSIVGATLFGTDDDKIGRIAQVLVDATDGHPTWAVVHVGTLARHSTFVPLTDATWENDDVSVPFSKDQVKHAPRIDSDGGLDPTQEQELVRYYSTGSATDTAGADPGAAPDASAGRHEESR